MIRVRVRDAVTGRLRVRIRVRVRVTVTVVVKRGYNWSRGVHGVLLPVVPVVRP